jgi:hypothetical protein
MWLLDQIKRLIPRIENTQAVTYGPTADEVRRLLHRTDSPYVREALCDCSIIEDSENPYYAGILNTMSNHCVGTVPLLVSLLDDDELNEEIEDLWFEWAITNEIGSAIRAGRRTAAQTGLAVIIPYKKETDYKMKMGLKVVGCQYLRSPSMPDPNIKEGIEYYPNGDIAAVWIQEEDVFEPTRYDARNVIIWWKKSRPFPMFPECGPALTVYPSINRYLANVMREAELKTAMPMAVELSGEFYKPGAKDFPKGAFKYEPGMVTTLPPGTKLVGLNMAAMADDRSKLTEHLVATAARCIDMPKVLAIASSADSNMATAHIDLQPWRYVVDIDRFDYEPAIRKIKRIWYNMALFHLPAALSAIDEPRCLFNYTVLFAHPDPVKCANARAKDLESGSSTLTAIYADQGKNARREIRKDCKLLGLTPVEFYERLLKARFGEKNDQTLTDQGQGSSQQQGAEAS